MERLSGMDAFFLYLETPSQHMHVTLCAVLDPATIPDAEPADGPGRGGRRRPAWRSAPGWDFELVKAHIASRVDRIPPFHRRLMPVPLRLHHPVWIDDPDFSIDNHVFRAALPAPGGPAELTQFVAQVAGVPLDRSRPLWEAWLVEGLEDGRVALVAKVHHSALDGVAGVENLVHLFDLEPLPATPPPGLDAERDAAVADGIQTAGGGARRAMAIDTVPTEVELMAYATVSRVKGLFDVLPLLGRTATGLLAVRNRRRNDLDPLASDELNLDGRPAQAGTPLSCPPTPFNSTITAQRRVAFARLALDDIKRVRAAAGATVNDVILAVCAGALRQYLLQRGDLPDEPLVAACPVNVRTAEQVGAQAGNRVSAMFTLLHTELASPAERLDAAKRTAAAAKEEHSLFAPDTLQQWAEVADPNVFTWLSDLYSSMGLAGRHRPAINVMISNVPGPPFPLYLAGARLERAYPMGQIIDGVGLNITVMSYCDGVDVGLMAAANLVPDLAVLADAVAPALADLLDAYC